MICHRLKLGLNWVLLTPIAYPHRVVRFFRFFMAGEGLAVAVSLEDETYAVDEIVEDLATCVPVIVFPPLPIPIPGWPWFAEAFGFSDCTGYLKAGLPVEYGEGAVEALANGEQLLANGVADMEFSHGDLERLDIEWRSLSLNCPCSKIGPPPME